MKAHIRTIDKKVEMAAVELTANEKACGALVKIQYTDLATGRYFFVLEYPQRRVKTEVFEA